MESITLYEQQFPVSYGHLAYSIYMQDGRSLKDVNEHDNIYRLHYAALQAGARRAKSTLSLSYEDFLIALDDHKDAFQALIDMQTKDEQPKK